MSTSQILSLLQRREELLKELSHANGQIIRIALEHNGDQETIPGLRRGRAAKGEVVGARRKWFSRGEMLDLSQKILTKPMSQAELVRHLLAAKGYDKDLPASEQARFKSAAYQAIAAAINAKQFTRGKDGTIALRKA